MFAFGACNMSDKRGKGAIRKFSQENVTSMAQVALLLSQGGFR
jgi:hypothetical protein